LLTIKIVLKKRERISRF